MQFIRFLYDFTKKNVRNALFFVEMLPPQYGHDFSQKKVKNGVDRNVLN